MLKVKTYKNGLPLNRMYGLLCLLFLAFVVFYPIADAALDAFSDHLTHSPRMLPESRMQSDQQKHPSKIIAIVQQAAISAISTIVDGPAFQAFITRAIPASIAAPVFLDTKIC